jgi:hypothetical protein
MQRREWLLITLLLVIMILKGVMWAVAFPLWQGPDEDDHFAVIQFVAEMGRLPDEGDEFLPDEITLSREIADVGRLDYNPEQRQAFSDSAIGSNEAQFAELPSEVRSSFELGGVGKLMHATPLYYVLAVPVYKLFDSGTLLDRAFAQRIFAVLASSPIVIVAYLITRHLFPRNAAMRLTIPTLVAFQPMITEISAVVSTDGLFFVLYSLAIYVGLLIIRDGLTRKWAVWLAVVFIVGFLIKPTMNGFAPLIVLILLYDWLKAGDKLTLQGIVSLPKGSRRRTIIWNTMLMGAIVIVPALWWIQRSLRLNGDPLYFNPVVKGHRILENPFYDYGFLQHMYDYYQSVFGGLFVTWWAHFGWLDTPLPPWVYNLLRVLTFVAMAGVVYLLVKYLRGNRPIRTNLSSLTQNLFPWFYLALAVVLPVILIQYYDLTFWREYGVGRGLQGRYWLTTVVPMLIFFVVGLLVWVPRKWHTATHVILRVAMIMFNIIALIGYILPRYYL